MDGWPGAAGPGEAAGGVGYGRSAHVRALAGRVGQCWNDSEQVLAGLHNVRLLDWQSPAGRAYRDSVGRQCDALRLAGTALQLARGAVTRHAEAVAEKETRAGHDGSG